MNNLVGYSHLDFATAHRQVKALLVDDAHVRAMMRREDFDKSLGGVRFKWLRNNKRFRSFLIDAIHVFFPHCY